MGSTFACSDIHGNFDAWIRALEKSEIDFEKGDNLIILGDLIDRGPDSFKCVSYAFELMDKYPSQVAYLIGNHEKMMVDFLMNKNPKSIKGYSDLNIDFQTWTGNGGVHAIGSFLDGFYDSSNALEVFNLFHRKHKELIERFSNLPYYKVDEDKELVYVHAGFKSGVMLSNQSKKDMVWIRDSFYDRFEVVPGDVLEGKIIIHGHTPVQFFGQERGFFNGGHHICIDGGSAMNKKVIILRVDDFSFVEEAI